MSFRFLVPALGLSLLVASVVTAFLACQPPPFVPPSACKTDSDCAGTQRCNQGSCQASTPPATDCKPQDSRPCFSASSGCVSLPDTTFKCTGACKAGTQTCDSQGKWGGCQGEIPPKAQEDCKNGQDDDCNGMTDGDDPTCKGCKDGETRPCFSGPASAKNVGICKEGKQSCSGGTWGACTEERLPKEEDCTNGLDDDCNGKTDYDDPACNLKACTSQDDCKGLSAAFCLTARGQAKGFCVRSCEPQSPCPQGLICKAPLIFGPSYCLKPVPSGESCILNDLARVCPLSTECNPVSSKCEALKPVAPLVACLSPDQCPADHACVLLPLSGRCLRKCTSDGDCANSSACVKISNPFQAPVSICLSRCASDAECVLETSCRKESWADPNYPHCLPKGTLALWDPCHPNSRNCGPGLRCFMDDAALPTRPIGYCTPDTCSTRDDCKNPDAICADYKQKRTCLIPCKDKPSVCSSVTDSVCRLIDSSQAPFCSP